MSRRLSVPLLLATFLAPVPASAAIGALPFVRDDYPQALAAARSRNLPLFIEAWAPW